MQSVYLHVVYSRNAVHVVYSRNVLLINNEGGSAQEKDSRSKGRPFSGLVSRTGVDPEGGPVAMAPANRDASYSKN